MTLEVVPLAGGAGNTTSLGFGCSALVSGRTRTQSLRLLDAAFDAGIARFGHIVLERK